MTAKLSAFVVWLLVAAGLVFWGYRLFARPLAAPAQVQTVGESVAARGDLSRLLGAAPAPAAFVPAPAVESNRFRLLGVLAPLPPKEGRAASTAGVALIAVDGKPARAYAVGARLDGDLVLQSVTRRSVAIGPAQAEPNLVLELPPPAPPATGTLPRAMADGDPRAMSGPSMQRPPPMPPQAMPQPPKPGDEGNGDEEDDEAAPSPQQRRGGALQPGNR